jgi:2-dehydro-3-deoxy-D-arabinonate dehydratase
MIWHKGGYFMLLMGSEVRQVIGGAYTYQPSLAMRKRLTQNIAKHHSSQYDNFTFFYKAPPENVAATGEQLTMRKHPATGEKVPHWPEAELALLLGERHEVIAITLANDFTAYSIEVQGRDENFDGTYFGKVWPTSCALGPDFVTIDKIGDLGQLNVGMKINRQGKTIYENAYSTNRRRREFHEIPELAVAYRRSFGEHPPPSKAIPLDGEYLPAGTVLMLGTGIIVPKRAYSEPGDVVTIYCDAIGELVNAII